MAAPDPSVTAASPARDDLVNSKDRKLSAEDLTIRDITARAVLAPMTRPVTTASGHIPAAPLVLIDVATEQGVTGRSYLFGYTPVTLRALVALIGDLTEMLKGQAVDPAARMRASESAFRLVGRQGLLGMAISGLDMAYWDALGRARDTSVARLLGGDETPIRAYDSFGIIDPDRDAGILEDSLDQGFTAIKIKVGHGDLADDIASVSGTRRIIGDTVKLMIDYNQSLNVRDAIARIRRLAEFGLTWVEEPVAAEDLKGHTEVRRASPVAIQTGENWWFPGDAARAIDARAMDYAMPDLMKIGGISGWRDAAALLGIAMLPTSSHTFIEASTHVLAVTPTAHYLEHLDLASAVLVDPQPVVDGTFRPRGPGLGMDWNEDAVSRYSL